MDEQTGATVVEIIDEEPEEVEDSVNPRTETIDFNGASEYRQQNEEANREGIYHS